MLDVYKRQPIGCCVASLLLKKKFSKEEQNAGIGAIAMGFCGITEGAISYTAADPARTVSYTHLSMLKSNGVNADFIQVAEGITRINVKIRAQQESEINGMGPAIKKENIDELYKKLDQLQDGDILVLAGSIPSVMPVSYTHLDVYKRQVYKAPT